MRVEGFDFVLDDFQAEALEYINNGKSVVVCAPTGAGKTCIAEFAIQRALKNGQRLFYTTPLKALSNQKFRDFGQKYGENNVGLLTGDTSINREAPIVVMTTEVFRNMLYGTAFGSVKDNVKNVKYVVLDEVHYMNDEQRGTVWEESIIYCPTDIQIIALSATVANSQELVDWINTVHQNTEHVYTDFRPVPLRFFYYDSSKMGYLAPLMTPEGILNNKLRQEKNTKDFRRKLPQKSAVKDVVATLHKKEMLPAIYFTFSRKKCNEQMEKCSGLSLLTLEEQQQVKQIVNEYLTENPYLANNEHIEYILQGVAAHHAGLLPGWKVLVEKLFQKGLIKVVFATETLAAGINMPARTCVISAISKRTDSGHRKLTANEFLQMSGRAGRRGMDDVGYVVITSTPFESAQDVYELATSSSDDLESRFAPGYSMVTNLLQRFSLDEAKELILKSFGYFSSAKRLTPYYLELDETNQKMEKIREFKCFKGAKIEDILEFNKRKNIYVEFRNIYKTLKRQAQKTKRKNAPEVEEYEQKVKALYQSMSQMACCDCKLYKKHIKDLELLERFQKRAKQLNSQIAYEHDVYWKQFLAHRKVLQDFGYLTTDCATSKGEIVARIRAENELFVSEIILSGVLDNLTPADLSSVICAISTEDMRIQNFAQISVSQTTRKALNKIKEIRKNIYRIQRDNNIEREMYINTYFTPLIEYWVNGGEWQELIDMTEISEGDIVRGFKRTIDLLRQITILPDLPDTLVQNARDAINSILREPIDVD